MSRFFPNFAIWFTILVIASVSCVNATPTFTPAPTAPVWEKEFPLTLNNTWIYHAMRYDGFNHDDIMSVARVITETVVEIRSTPPYYAAKIRQDLSAEVPVYVPPSMRDIPPDLAGSDEYWLVVEGNRIYRQKQELDLSNLSTGTVELMFPLELDAKWYAAEELEKLDPAHKNYSMLYQVTRVGSINVPAAQFGTF